MKTQLFWCFQRVIVAWFYICTVSVGNTIMASVLYCMAHGFYFSDFSSGCNQKNTKKKISSLVPIQTLLMITLASPSPIKNKRQNPKQPKTEKREKNTLGENK